MQNLINDLTKILLEGDWFKAEDWLEETKSLGYSPIEIQEDIIKASMYNLGRFWEKNMITVADEHLATITADFLLTRLQPAQAPAAPKPLAMLFCIEGEEHYIGLKMSASILRENGWNVKMLGSNLPIDHAVYFARKWKPDLVGMSISISTLLPNLLKCEEKIRALPHQPMTLIGGRLVSLYNLESHIDEKTILVSDLYDLERWAADFSSAEEVKQI
ncbi:cobalamin B12-binding domain-containing protein [Falsibacillus pallidus]|uniref:Methanogenic corrinoid protein MtbC1 n=1 Tax=Falsibacillus pallidus TaxID=493781 RepID=A0A370GF32_9BACI|nr:cobalamin-dependent protein [Falsibacillus pallidus]RDI42281.1 methanogenic corrinoid protein MtbC1 [Falsibacillus pallidus]